MAPLAQHRTPTLLCYPHRFQALSSRAAGSWLISSLLPQAWMSNDLHLSVGPPLEASATMRQPKDVRAALRTSTGYRARQQRHRPKRAYPCPNGLRVHASAALPLFQPFPRLHLSADNPPSLAITLCNLTGWRRDCQRRARPSHCPPFPNNHTSLRLLADGTYSQRM